MAITAKAKVTGKHERLANSTGTDKTKTVVLTFNADYADNRNKEWAAYTPHLNFEMTVKEEVAKLFEVGDSFTVTFAPED